MAFEQKILQRAAAQLVRRKEARARSREALERKLYGEAPRLRELDNALRDTMIELADLIAAGRPVEADGPEVSDIRRRNQALQEERAQLIASLGHDKAELEAAPLCPLCGDTGWTKDGMCTCLRELCAQEQMKELSSLLSLTDEQSFDKLRLDVYSDLPWQGKPSPREHMELVIEISKGFAKSFPKYPYKNLLLSGSPGLGKTFLSGCIAREVSSRGFSVVYDTAARLFAAFEARRFTRDQEEGRQARDDTRRYLNCDLLILDDLGSEFTSPLAQATLYEVVDRRLVDDRRTVISTNLSGEQIAQRYTPQTASRLRGLYRELTFYGDDIRPKMR